MLRRPTTSTRTNTLFPYTTLFRSPECKVGNICIDRSGREPIPHAQVEPYDDMWIIKADQWLGDVLYAVRVGEEASKDRPIDFCRVACEYFSVCRTEALADREEGGLISSEDERDAVRARSEEHTSELQSLMRIPYAVFCLKNKTKNS